MFHIYELMLYDEHMYMGIFHLFHQTTTAGGGPIGWLWWPLYCMSGHAYQPPDGYTYWTSKDWISNDRTSNDRTSNDSTSNDWMLNDRTLNDWTSNDWTSNDQTLNDWMSNDWTLNDRTSNDWMSNDWTSTNKVLKKTKRIMTERRMDWMSKITWITYYIEHLFTVNIGYNYNNIK